MSTSPAPRSLLHNRDYQLLMTGRTIAVIGQSMSGLAFTLIAFDMTHSPAAAGVIASISMVGMLLMQPFAGVLVDRHDRRKLLVFSAVIAGLATATIPIAQVLGVLTIAQLAVVGFISGLADTFYSPAETASVKRVVHQSQLGEAMSINQARGAFAQIVGPLLGGALYAVNRVVPFVVDAAAALVSAVCAGFVRTDLRPSRLADDELVSTSIWQDMVGGFRYLLGRRELVALALMACLANFSMTAELFAVIVDLQRRGTNPAVIGSLEMTIGIAGLVGAVLSAPMLKRVAVGPLLVIMFTVTAVGLGCLVMVTSVPGIMTFLVVVMLLVPSANAGLGSYFVARVHDEMQGRASSVLSLVSMGMMPLAQILAGVLLEHVGRAPAILLGTVGMASVVLIVLVVPEIRSIPKAADFVPIEEVAAA